jgi:hypothetical protein
VYGFCTTFFFVLDGALASSSIIPLPCASFAAKKQVMEQSVWSATRFKWGNFPGRTISQTVRLLTLPLQVTALGQDTGLLSCNHDLPQDQAAGYSLGFLEHGMFQPQEHTPAAGICSNFAKQLLSGRPVLGCYRLKRKRSHFYLRRNSRVRFHATSADCGSNSGRSSSKNQ